MMVSVLSLKSAFTTCNSLYILFKSKTFHRSHRHSTRDLSSSLSLLCSLCPLIWSLQFIMMYLQALLDLHATSERFSFLEFCINYSLPLRRCFTFLGHMGHIWSLRTKSICLSIYVLFNWSQHGCSHRLSFY